MEILNVYYLKSIYIENILIFSNICSFTFMKIALSCNSPFAKGGQGQFLKHASLGFSELDDLSVFCSESNNHSSENFSFPINALGNSYWSKKLASIPYLRRRQDWTTLLSDSYFDKQLSYKLQSNHYDLIVGVAGQTFRSFQVAGKTGAKRVLYCLNSYLPFMKQQLEEEKKFLGDTSQEMHPQMLRRFASECQQADLILLNSEVAKKTFIKAGFCSEKLAVLTPPVDTQKFRPTPKPDSVFRVLYIGTINARKGVHYLLQAFTEAKMPNSELLLVGGVATRRLKRLLQNALKQHNNLKQEHWDFSDDDPTQVFGRCAVLVLPSVEDSFGLVALEAMACGLPVIVTSHCGVADVVQEGVNGFVVPPRDTSAITQKLIFLAQNQAVASEMSKAARLTAEYHTQQRYNHDIKQIFLNQGFLEQ